MSIKSDGRKVVLCKFEYFLNKIVDKSTILLYNGSTYGKKFAQKDAGNHSQIGKNIEKPPLFSKRKQYNDKETVQTRYPQTGRAQLCE